MKARNTRASARPTGSRARWGVDDGVFRILAVCTGNVCRSPVAERALQSGFDELAPGRFQISSAGTSGLSGDPVTEEITKIAADAEIDFTGFRARRLVPEHIDGADLVLTMARDHRSAVVVMAPSALGRTFTLREFARILPRVPPESASDPVERWRALAVLARRYRHAGPGDGDDVVDPYGRSAKTHQRMYAQMMPAIGRLLDWERSFGRNEL